MPTILIVDDDEIIREALSDLFAEDYLCHVAVTAEEALTHLSTQEYDIVITDISMPGMKGDDLLGFIKAYQPWTQVIFITGSTCQEQAERLKARAFSFLQKPFPLAEIEAQVQRAVEHRRTQAAQRQRMLDERRPPSQKS